MLWEAVVLLKPETQ